MRRSASFLLSTVAVLGFHVAWFPGAAWVMTLFASCLILLTGLPSLALRFGLGLAIGLGIYGPKLSFFWSLFGPSAVVLWLILAYWPAIFLAVGGELRGLLSPRLLVVALPVLWTGLEYFRSELYFLKFSWISPGHAFSTDDFGPVLRIVGVYGTGLMVFVTAASLTLLQGKSRWIAAGLPVLVGVLPFLGRPDASPTRNLRVAGAQVESVLPEAIPGILEQLSARHPEAELVVLPEYTLEGPPTPEIREWCKRRGRHLIVGGRDRLSGGGFRNTAWVVDPRGETVGSQVKSVPIQFFDDGEAATSQTCWQSPWGTLGIAICYDLSYSRVMDRLARQGAQAFVIPTMDSEAWGENQHRLHARIPPMRAAEYGVPIIRSASCGVSQLVDARGQITASAPYSSEVEYFSGSIEIGPPARLPIDRALAPLCSAISAPLVGWAAIRSSRRRSPAVPSPVLPA